MRKLLYLAALLLGLPLVLIFWAEMKLSRLPLGGLGEAFSTKVYSAPLVLSPGARKSREDVLARLKRLQYEEAPETLEAGQYASGPEKLRVYLRSFEAPGVIQSSQIATVTFGASGIKDIEDEAGDTLSSITFEEELVAELSGAKRVRREPTSWEEIPKALVDAVVATEDKRFFRHHGVDFLAIGRALLHNLRHRTGTQGGSTISQQLAKNLLLTPKKTLVRKALDAFFGVYLDWRLSKERILTLYLNQVYLGQEGHVSVAGVEAGARFYFNKDISRLNLPECATLAGIIRSPYHYNPFTKPANAQARRDFVLKRMLEEGLITEEDFKTAAETPLITKPARQASPSSESQADYFLDEVIRELMEKYEPDVIFRSGLSVRTTLDPRLQAAAQRAVRRARPQGALAAMDPFTGEVKALAGGKDFRESQFNRATRALRQPGSAFKPFVYGAALEKGFTLASVLMDQAKAYERENGEKWNPRNFNGVYRGTVTAYESLINSLNLATLDLAQRTGVGPIIDFARKLGIEHPLQENLGLGLGVSEVTLLELTSAYCAFANGGFRVRPFVISSVVDADLSVLEFNPIERAPALDPSLSYLVSWALKSAVEEGTGRSLKDRGWKAPAAGKTGTTTEGKDAWFIGYTPALIAGVWVGEDSAKPMGLSGAKDAIPIWAAFMKDGGGALEPADFPRPENIITRKIDLESGLLARSGCPRRKDLPFLEGTQPLQDCPLHAGGIRGLLRRFFKEPGVQKL